MRDLRGTVAATAMALGVASAAWGQTPDAQDGELHACLTDVRAVTLAQEIAGWIAENGSEATLGGDMRALVSAEAVDQDVVSCALRILDAQDALATPAADAPGGEGDSSITQVFTQIMSVSAPGGLSSEAMISKSQDLTLDPNTPPPAGDDDDGPDYVSSN